MTRSSVGKSSSPNDLAPKRLFNGLRLSRRHTLRA